MPVALKLVIKKLVFPNNIPRIPSYVVFSPRVKRCNSDCKNLDKTEGASFDLSEELALQRAISEVIERYTLLHFKEGNFVEKTPKELGDGAVPLNEFIIYPDSVYHTENFTLKKFTSNLIIRWVKSRDIYSGEAKYLPADYIYPKSVKKRYSRIEFFSSNGAAAGSTEKQAITNGLCEVIERDALMCHWFTRMNIVELTLNVKINNAIENLIRVIVSTNRRLSIYLVTNEFGISTILALIRSKTKPYYSFGSSCKLNIAVAIERAIEEAIMILRSQTLLYQNRYKHGSSIITLIDHIMLTSNREYCGNLLYLDKVKTSSKKELIKVISSHPRSLKEIVSRLRMNGYNCYCVNTTTDQARSLGLYAGKVVVPGLYPLERDQRFLHAGLQRLKRFTKSSGMIYNKLPHPFG